MAKVCRARPKYNKWTPVLDTDGYCKMPPRTLRKTKADAHVAEFYHRQKIILQGV